MLDFINKTIAQLFGSKSERDLKELQPVVIRVLAEYDKIQGISNDELRAKTGEFKNRISEYTQDTLDKISELRKEAEDESDIMRKEELYTEIDKLKKILNDET